MVSVVIATKDRAELLSESIHSVLSQTFKDFELLIIDDGSSDNTREVVESFGDSRVRYHRVGEVSRGISAARNIGADLSRGEWTAVHDDDDLMLPSRLERQIAVAQNSHADFVFGAFINFDNETGALQLHHGREFNYGSALKTGFAPGHSTWLVKTRLIRHFRYDEGLESAVDNNLAFRMLRSGVTVVHSGVVCLLRRVHSGRITATGGSNQKYAAELNRSFLQRGISADAQRNLWKNAQHNWGPVDKDHWQSRFLPFLPDHLVRRSGPLIKNLGGGRYSLSGKREMDWLEFIYAKSRGFEPSLVEARYRESEYVEKHLPLEQNEEVDLEQIAVSLCLNSVDLEKRKASECGAFFLVFLTENLESLKDENFIGDNIGSLERDGQLIYFSSNFAKTLTECMELSEKVWPRGIDTRIIRLEYK